METFVFEKAGKRLSRHCTKSRVAQNVGESAKSLALVVPEPRRKAYADELATQGTNTLVEQALASAQDLGLPEAPAPQLRSLRPLVGESRACTKCGADQDLSQFAIKRGGRATACRSCQKSHSDANYLRNKEARIAAAAVRNAGTRLLLVAARDFYLASQCVCEACSSTVDLRLTAKPGYTGLNVHEVIAGALGTSRLDEALEGSQVLCLPCMGSKQGKAGGLAKKANRLKAELASDGTAQD